MDNPETLAILGIKHNEDKQSNNTENDEHHR